MFPVAAIIKGHELGGLTVFSHSSGDEKSKSKASERLHSLQRLWGGASLTSPSPWRLPAALAVLGS